MSNGPILRRFEDAAFEKVTELVATFKANERMYLSPDYQEAEVRKDFIDKFWIALGWDVNHDSQRNPYEQEVKVERHVAVGTAQRRADYGFYLAPNFRDARFFVEAKKPYGDLATADNYFQAIRYGWNNRNAVVVLTDFKQLHVLDCRHKPDINSALDKALYTYDYNDYGDLEKFGYLYWFFSREALATGSFDRRLEELPKPRGAAVQRGLFPGAYKPVDEAFLEDLDEFRTTLAHTFKAKNPSLDGETLTELAQRTLDRLVFLRFLEDRGIEPRIVDRFGATGVAWQEFVAASRRLDGVYNGIVFKHHDLLDGPTFHVEDEAFSGICEQLASVNTPYEFNSIPIHILGSIYERFLGNVIVATERRVRIEPKPEVRKAGGVYYTPEYIVRYIVEQTVGTKIAGKTPADIAKMRFADIACGSGSFLLGIYDLLIEHHGNYYNANPSKAKKGDYVEREGKLYLSLAKKRDILLNNIYGVDIDPQAVEVAQLSLYLRLLKEETPATAHQFQLEFAHDARMKKLLPDLSRNIVSGNSLVASDIFDEDLLAGEEERRLNVLDFGTAFPEVTRTGGFDAIIGNPPYISMLLLDKSQSRYTKRYWKKHYSSASGAFDIYVLFIERALTLVKDGGLVSYIVPNKFMAAEYAVEFRKWLLEVSQFVSLVDLSRVKVWPVAVYPVIPVFQRGRSEPSRLVKVAAATRASLQEGVQPLTPVPPKQLEQVPDLLWSFMTQKGADVLLRVLDQSVPLEEIAEVWGASTVAEGSEYPRLMSEDGASGRVRHDVARFVVSGSVVRYGTTWQRDPVQFMHRKYTKPLIRLRAPMPQRRAEQARQPKIIIAKVALEPRAFADVDGEYLGAYTTYVFPREMPISALTAIFNSTLVRFAYRLLYDALAMGGGYLRFQPPQVRRIPVKSFDAELAEDRRRLTRLTELGRAASTARAQLIAAKTDKDKGYLARRCATIDRLIDTIVYQHYGLNDAQIALVEQMHS